ncbi:hypothetical protein [Planctomicrobium sp. SH664]|uniref:hypothetical protein n=1 Tax=Planctomicrobium sp. SH664 TaxID=3448125 RepID=UPI003F5B959F
MWCEHCLTDIATEVSQDGQNLLCTTCGNVVHKVHVPSLHPETRSAREILERWAKEQQAVKEARKSSPTDAELQDALANVLNRPLASKREVSRAQEQTSHSLPEVPREPVILSQPEIKPPAADQKIEVPPAVPVLPTVPVPPPAEPAVQPALETPVSTADKVISEAATVTSLPTEYEGKKLRFDVEHQAPEGPAKPQRERKRRPRMLDKIPQSAVPVEATSPPVPEIPPASPLPSPQAAAMRPNYTLDESHASVPDPHFDIRKAARPSTSYPGRAEAVWGQLLAYGGVGLLTVGTVLVLWGYFGGIENYASTGWLVATAGNMILLLGIVTLVSGGMQQTTHEVSQRIEHLGGRMVRIEESTDRILKGPHFRRRKSRRGSAATREQKSDAA